MFSSHESVHPIVSQNKIPINSTCAFFFTAVRIWVRNWAKPALKLRCMVIKISHEPFFLIYKN